jgi:hypothetical protein
MSQKSVHLPDSADITPPKNPNAIEMACYLRDKLAKLPPESKERVIDFELLIERKQIPDPNGSSEEDMARIHDLILNAAKENFLTYEWQIAGQIASLAVQRAIASSVSEVDPEMAKVMESNMITVMEFLAVAHLSPDDFAGKAECLDYVQVVCEEIKDMPRTLRDILQPQR